MSNTWSRERMNKNSQHEFRFTSQVGLPIACTRCQSRGPARDGVQFMNDGLPMYPFSGGEYPIGRHLQGTRILVQRYRQAGIRTISRDFCEGGRRHAQ